MSRLTPVQGQPFPSIDVPLTGTLFDCDYGEPGVSLNLAGRAPLSLLDVWSDDVNLYTTPMPVMEVLLTGTPIGGMTGTAGLAAVFDGNPNKPYLACAESGSSSLGFTLPNAAGLALPPGAVVNRLIASSPNNNGFIGTNQSTLWQLLGSNTNNIATATQIASGHTPPVNPYGVAEVEVRLPKGVSYGFIWFVLYGNGINNTWLCQLRPYMQLSVSARGIVGIAGVLMNANALIGAIGNSGPVSLAPQSVKYRGTILISETTGQIRQKISFGPNLMLPIFNATDRRRIVVTAGDDSVPGSALGGYAYAPVPQTNFYLFYPSHGNPNVSVTLVNGLAEGSTLIENEQTFFQNGQSPSPAVTAAWVSSGIKSVSQLLASPVTGTTQLYPNGGWGQQNFDTVNTDEGLDLYSSYSIPPFCDALTIFGTEGVRGNTEGFFGEANMRLTVSTDA
jgi:hypothetical protein